MELHDSLLIDAPRARVFAALQDADILRQAIPGCEALDAVSPTEFTATVSAKIGPLKARFTGQVALADIVPDTSYTLTGEGRGGPAGHAKVRSQVRLEDEGAATRLHYDVKADIGGKLAQLGGALVQKTAERLAAEFFQAFETLVSADRGEPQEVLAAPAEPSRSDNAGWLLVAAGVAALAVLVWLIL